MKTVVIYIYLNLNNNNNYINNHGLTQYILEERARERVRERQRIGCNIIMPNKRSYAQQQNMKFFFLSLVFIWCKYRTMHPECSPTDVEMRERDHKLV